MRKVGLSRGLKVLFILLIFSGVIFAQDWALPLNLVSGDGVDTITVTLGVHYTATDLFDEGLDMAFPMAPPPPVRYAYFPIEDPEYPGINMLGTDFRDPVSEHEWVIVLDRDYTSTEREVFWDMEDLPFPDSLEDLLLAEELMIGAAYPSEEVPDTAWVDMSEVESFNFSAGKVVHVKFMPEGSIDMHPPTVTAFYPEDGADGVRRVRPIEFNIQDDITGVDESSITLLINDVEVPHDDFIVMDPILNGFHIEYLPEDDWPEMEDICAKIIAADLADPVHVMDTFESCFSTPSEPPDTFPPYYEDLSIEDGDTLNIWESVFIKLLDTERGVDESSITVTVNGVEYTNFELSLFTEFLYDYNIEIMPPASGWNPGEYYEVVVHGCDRADEPNCVDTTFTFVAGGIEPPPFEYSMYAYSIEGTDTTRNMLSIGTDPDATEGYDSGYDIASPSPDFTTFGYFPLSDPTYPYVNKLSKDVKRTAQSVTWQIEFNNPDDVVGIAWDIDELEEIIDTIGSIRIGYGNRDSLRWRDMLLYDHIDFAPEHNCYIRYTTVTTDTAAPRVWGRDPYPAEVDVPLSTNIQFDLLDPESGVDPSSIVLRFGTIGGSLTTVDPEDYTLEMLPTGYRVVYDRPGMLNYNTTYVVRVTASDEAPSANSATHEWQFTTTTTCAPMFESPLSLTDGEDDISLVIGTDDDALVGRDDMDVPIPVAPPSGFFAYFPIEDDPIYDMLSTDIRPNCAGEQVWEIIKDRADGPVTISWDTEDIFFDEEWQLRVAAAAIGEEPEHADYETIMTEVDEFTFAAGENAFIKLGIWDTTESYCINGSVSLWGSDSTTIVNVSVAPIGVTYDSPPGGGPFEVCHLPNDTEYTLVLSAEGYVPETLSVYISGEDYIIADPIELRPPGTFVHGTVMVEGEDAPGISILLGEDATVTRADGSWAIDNVLPDVDMICYSGFGLGYPDTCEEIDVTGEDTVYVEFDYVAPSLRVYGTVSLDGELTEGVDIYRCGEDTPIATSDSLGNYEIIDVEVGPHCLVARYPGYDDHEESFYVTDNTEIDFNLIPGDITISGTVSNDCSEDVAGLTVEISGPAPSVYLGPDGSYEFEGLDWGEYTISVIGEYHAMTETTVTTEGDMVVDITAPCLPCVTSFTVVAAELERPLEGDEELNNTITWAAPVTDVPVDHYELYRNGTMYAADIPSDTEEYIDTDVDADARYDYYLVVIYDVEGEYNYSMDCASGSGTPTMTPDMNAILIIDYDGEATPLSDGTVATEVAMENLLLSPSLAMEDVGITITDQNPPDLNGYELADYDFVIVELGIRDSDDDLMTDDVCEDLNAYADMDRPGGTAILVEGPDFGMNYGSASGVQRDFFNKFGISHSASHDGSDETEGNVDSLFISRSFAHFEPYGTYAYRTEADRFVDDFTAETAIPFVYGNDMLVRATEKVVDGNNYRFASAIYTAAVSGSYGSTEMAHRIIGHYLNRVGIANEAITEVEVTKAPESFEISRVYPNPFNPATTIEFDVSEDANVTLEVYDVTGNLVRTLVEQHMTTGKYNVDFNASGLASGTYFVKLDVNGKTVTNKLMFMK
ncbi:MAG: T9SS type A sorting domain-containing protein [Candidatus Zixiibacteriota bacterium]